MQEDVTFFAMWKADTIWPPDQPTIERGVNRIRDSRNAGLSDPFPLFLGTLGVGRTKEAELVLTDGRREHVPKDAEV